MKSQMVSYYVIKSKVLSEFPSFELAPTNLKVGALDPRSHLSDLIFMSFETQSQTMSFRNFANLIFKTDASKKKKNKKT